MGAARRPTCCGTSSIRHGCEFTPCGCEIPQNRVPCQPSAASTDRLRGLPAGDCTPGGIADPSSSDDRPIIPQEEISHCAAGLKWFQFLHKGEELDAIVASFHSTVREHFHGPLKVRPWMRTRKKQLAL
eukprot:9471334-Pyramimonas_sp.AAC.1